MKTNKSAAKISVILSVLCWLILQINHGYVKLPISALLFNRLIDQYFLIQIDCIAIIFEMDTVEFI